MKNILSLGFGVQSFALACMAALGEIEKPDYIIHSDTTWEKRATYKFIKQWLPWLKDRSLDMIIVSNPQSWNELTGYKSDIPAFTAGNYEKSADFMGHEIIMTHKSRGMLRRQCTDRWKIRPMRRWIRQHKAFPARVWIGITTDEAHRMRQSDVRYLVNHYPLIDLGMSRTDCITWLQDHAIARPPKSACLFCPFHSKDEWAAVKSDPADWSKALLLDRTIRSARPPYQLYLYGNREPLETVDFSPQDNPDPVTQLGFWENECTGYCGI